MRITYLPKSHKEYEFIYEHLNKDFTSPKGSFNEFMGIVNYTRSKLSLVFYTSIEGVPEVLWGLEHHHSDIKTTSLEDFYKRYQEFKLEKLL